MHAAARRACQSFIGVGVIGRWRADEALYFVPSSRAAIHKSVISHAVHIQDHAQFTITDLYLGNFCLADASRGRVRGRTEKLAASCAYAMETERFIA